MDTIKNTLQNKTTSLTWFFVLMFIEMMFANLAHPATPFLIQQRMLPNYTFGFAFSAMAFTNFLFSPFWGMISNRYGRMTVYLIGCLGYALGQVGFALAMSFWMLIAARLVAGFFVGGVMVMHLTVVMDYSTKEDLAKNLTIHATVFTISGAAGYLIGGFIGDVSLPLLFTVQAVGLAFSGILAYVTFRQIPIDESEKLKKHHWYEDFNPLYAFKKSYKIMTWSLWIFMIIVFLSQVGSIAFDQSFNFYIREQFGFPPSANGMLKAAFGLLSLIVNMTIGLYLVRKTRQQKPLLLVLITLSLISLGLYLISDQVLFLIMSIMLFTLNSIYVILIQTIAGSLGRAIDHSMFMGLFNAIKSLGMIMGSSLVGIIYAIQANYSFVFTAINFALGALLLGIFIHRKGTSHHETT